MAVKLKRYSSNGWIDTDLMSQEIEDCDSPGRGIKIGYYGGETLNNTEYFAAFNADGTVIRDIAKSKVISILGINSKMDKNDITFKYDDYTKTLTIVYHDN